MEFKGTKGKWKAYMPDHIGCTNVKFGEEEWEGFIEVWHHYNGSMQAKANALLISKAPEMLEMLDRCLSICDKRQYPTEQELKSMAIDIQQLIKEATEL